MRIILCDTISHPTPILLEWSTGLRDLGHQVFYLPVPNHSIAEVQEEVDLLVYAGIQGNMVKEFELFKTRFPKTKIIGASSEWNPDYTNFKDIVDFFVGAIDHFPSVKKSYNLNGFEWYNIPLAANHHLFEKIDLPKKFDACFIGNLSHGYRGEDVFLYPILDNHNYQCFVGGLTYGRYQHGFVPYPDHNTIRNQTKVNINFHVPYQKPGMGEFPDRSDCNQSVFNIALSGNFQLCDHPLALKYFRGQVVVDDGSNWLELFDYYLHNEQEREEKAFNARQICLNEHTWLQRMKEFLIVVDNHFNR